MMMKVKQRSPVPPTVVGLRRQFYRWTVWDPDATDVIYRSV